MFVFYLQVENWDEWTGVDEERQITDSITGRSEKQITEDIDSKASKQQELIEASGSRRINKKRKSKFAESLERRKPIFDPNDKNFEQYFDEYYKLDYEDLIGDMPCRFKYRQVKANDFGLTTDGKQILFNNQQTLRPR